MKRIFVTSAVLLHIFLYADSITLVQSQQSLKHIFSDSSTKILQSSNNTPHTVYVPNSVTFSTQHKPSRHHTPVPQYDLNCMSTEQLIGYFNALHSTEEDILSYPMLYMRHAYLAIAKQLPRYPEFVKKYYNRYRQYGWFHEFCAWVNLQYKYGMKEQFEHLYQECEKQRTAQEAHEQKQRELKAQQKRETQEKKEAEVCQAYIRELKRVENILNDNSSDKRISINNHQERLEKIKMAQERPARTFHTLQTDQEAIDFATAYGITEHQVTHVTLNSYEYQLHKEFVLHIHSTLTLQRKYAVDNKNVFIDALGNGIALGMQSNHLHNPEWATRWSDFCYEATEIIKGIGEGIMLGSYNAVDMVMHPLRTLVRIADGVRMLGSLTARTVGTLVHWNYLIERGEHLQCATEMYSICEQLVSIANTIHEQTSQMSHREIAKQVTAFGAEWVLTGQMFTRGHSVCSKLGNTIKRTIQFLKDEGAAGEFALATMDGVLLKASENMNKGGGGVNNLIRDSRTVLDVVQKQYMTVVEAELESLRLLCDNKVLDTAHFGNKYLKPQYKHILGIELEFSRRGIPQVGGFHHDFMQTIEKSGVFRFVDKVVHKFGFYSAELYHGENFVKSITFFPADWSRKQVIEAIYGAYTNFVKSGMKPVLESNGKYRVDAVLNRQIKIRMYITKDAVIKTAYPILE